MAIDIGRRHFVVGLGGAAFGWPFAACAQQPDRMRRIGWLVGLRESDPEALRRTTAFVQELDHLGWTQGRNVHIDFRWLSDSIERNLTYSQELAALKPDVLVASSTPAIKALRQETGMPRRLFCHRDRSGQQRSGGKFVVAGRQSDGLHQFRIYNGRQMA